MIQSASHKVDLAAYERVRSRVGCYDMTHAAGRISGRGKDVLDLLHRMSTNDLRPLMEKPEVGGQTVLTNEKGRILDVLNVLSREDDTLIVVSSGREQAVIDWLDKFTIMEDAKFISITEGLHQIALIGPRSFDLVRQFTSTDLIAMPTLSAFRATIAGVPVLIQKYFRLAESGWMIFVQAPLASDVKSFLDAEVLAMNGAIVNDALYEVLRIESGMPTAPNELNEKRNPLETTLVSAVSFTKGCYIGQEVIARLDSYDKVQRHMLGVILEGSAADIESELHESVSLRGMGAGTATSFMLETSAGEAVGEMTSYAVSPGVGSVIGLAFIRTAHANPNTHLALRLGEGRMVSAKLVKLPFDV